MLTNKQLSILYSAGWKPIIDIDDKTSAGILSSNWPKSPARACQFKHVHWLNTDILMEYVVYSVPVWVNFPVYPDDDGY